MQLQRRRRGSGGIGEVRMVEGETLGVAAAEIGKPVVLELDRVVVVEIVEADDLVAAREQPRGQRVTDESCGAGDENGHETASGASL